MPVKVSINGTEVTLKPKADWTDLEYSTKIEKLAVNKDFYVLSNQVSK
jgi:hypothetical protein